MPLVRRTITIPPPPAPGEPSPGMLIAPGDIAQLSFQMPDDGRIKTPVVGEGARMVKLWAGKEQSVCPLPTVTDGVESTEPWNVDLPAKKGSYVILTVQNMLDEPAMFTAVFPLEVEIPEVAPPKTMAPLGLTQRINPAEEPKSTLADHGISKPGANEVGVLFMRNEAYFLINHLREGHSLPHDVKNTIVRRLDAVLKTKK